ncbi:MAG: non-hydrolyzing UDP-N-acetylglucosamine 2-epimerase [bacterium]
MIRVLNVVGARPNFMKIAPIHRAMLRTGGFHPLLVHTGQHYDWEMSDVFIRDLGLPRPDLELGVGSGSHVEQTAQVMLRLEPYLLRTDPHVVLVVGDVNSTLGAALAAVTLGVRVAHVEAGLRSFDRMMPEEINRVMTDVIADLLFAPSADAVQNLVNEGILKTKIHLVGNVMIDNLDTLLPRAKRSDIANRLNLRPHNYLVATLHRPSNVDVSDTLSKLSSLLVEVASIAPTVLVAHPRTQERLRQTGEWKRLEDGRVQIMEPLGYIDFLALMSTAAAVLTDSGGIQEETTVLGVPCLTMRDTTERPITVTEGTNQIVGLDIERIQQAVERIVAGKRVEASRPDLWDGRAAKRIVDVLRKTFDR